MQFWLLKTEPSTWSWQDQIDRGNQGEGWDGVRNYQASNNMKAMQIGDLAFFYHSVNEKQIVGIVAICAQYHPDPTDASNRFGMVTVKAVKPLNTPMTLADITANERFQEMALVRQSQLSVTPVSAEHWAIIMQKGNAAMQALQCNKSQSR